MATLAWHRVFLTWKVQNGTWSGTCDYGTCHTKVIYLQPRYLRVYGFNGPSRIVARDVHVRLVRIGLFDDTRQSKWKLFVLLGEKERFIRTTYFPSFRFVFENCRMNVIPILGIWIVLDRSIENELREAED